MIFVDNNISEAIKRIAYTIQQWVLILHTYIPGKHSTSDEGACYGDGRCGIHRKCKKHAVYSRKRQADRVEGT